MSPFDRTGFEALVQSLPGTSIADQWDARVAKVGDKVFTLLTDTERRICFKVSEESFEILTSLEGIGQAPYFAKRKWVSITDSELGEADLEEYLTRSYRTVSASLTRKLRAELGIVE
ncbi:MAG: MmcQ/YjbR family DNA-binding protein [Allorhizobium sp.]